MPVIIKSSKALSLLCLALAPVAARGASLAFTPITGSTSPGQSFSFNVNLDTDHPFYGFSTYLNASAPNAFTVTGQTILTGSPLPDPNFIGTLPFIIPTSGNSADLGYTENGTKDIVAGNYPIETLTISVAPNVPYGTYTITTTTGVAGSEYNDAEGDEYDLPAASYSVLVPEPASGLILFGAAAGLLAFRRHRHPRATE